MHPAVRSSGPGVAAQPLLFPQLLHRCGVTSQEPFVTNVRNGRESSEGAYKLRNVAKKIKQMLLDRVIDFTLT